MSLQELLELQQLKDEIRSKGYYIDITLHAGDEVIVQIGEPETNVSEFAYGCTELLAIKLTWNRFLQCQEDSK